MGQMPGDLKCLFLPTANRQRPGSQFRWRCLSGIWASETKGDGSFWCLTSQQLRNFRDQLVGLCLHRNPNELIDVLQRETNKLRTQ